MMHESESLATEAREKLVPIIFCLDGGTLRGAGLAEDRVEHRIREAGSVSVHQRKVKTSSA